MDAIDRYIERLRVCFASPGGASGRSRGCIAVLGTDEGDEYCFETRHLDERGEYPIVLWNHETCGLETTEFETQSGDLGEFLLGSLGEEPSP
jgi:hypothetical protein